MTKTAESFFKAAILFLILGMGAGIMMAASHDHAIGGAHAHLNLLGFVVSSIYGTYFALQPSKAGGRLPSVVLWLHVVGVVVMFVSLSMLLTGTAAAEPVVALSSLIVLFAAVLFAVIVWRPVSALRGAAGVA